MVSVNLIIDCNYILNKNVYSLHKNNLLFGGLYKSLELSVANYRKWFPFANVYLVSDSKGKSWRKELIHDNYKSQRKKNVDIDWNFVYNTYDEFKKNVIGAKVLEGPRIEGDDWIYYVTKRSNDDNKSVIIVSNDYDIKQLLKFSTNNGWLNIMSNEMNGKEKIFVPKNYQMVMNKINSSVNNDDIFNLNDDNDFINLMNKFLSKYEIVEVDSDESLFTKIVAGDDSDNIKSVYVGKTKTGKPRGLGDKSAKEIYDMYLSEFGEVDFDDPDIHENIADLILEFRKLSSDNMDKIKTNIENNFKLINLHMIPYEIKDEMRKVYESASVNLRTIPEENTYYEGL